MELAGESQEETSVAIAVNGDLTTAVPVKVHSFPSKVRVTETHVVKSSDSVSYKPLSLEEAVKEAVISRPRSFRLPRSGRPSESPASQARRQNGVDRSAVMLRQ